MRHCFHANPLPTCDICRRYDADPTYRVFSDRTAARLRAAGAAAAECIYKGKPTAPPPGKSVQKRWSLCSHPDQPLGPAVCPCEGCGPKCTGYVGEDAPNYEWVSTAQLVRDAVILAGKLPPNCSGVAGIPRSGMTPASVIATHLHIPLYQLTEDGNLERLGHGSRGRCLGFDSSDGPIAVVDDTVYGGSAMARAKKAMAFPGRPEAVFAAVYVRPEAAGAVDHYARLLPSPHILEWNFANNGPVAGFAANPCYGKGVAFDLDGVIVHDKESGGPVGSPYLVPKTHPVLIVTGRRESHRAVTEEHLRRLGAKWHRLEMLPDDAPEGIDHIAAHKAKHYAASGCGFYAESCPKQAELINKLSGKPVICPVAGKVFTGPVRGVVFDPPAPVDSLFRVPPRSSRAIVTIRSGEYGRKLAEISESLIRRYAERFGADYIRIDGGGHPRHPEAAKWRVGDVCRRYDRTLYLDLDVTFDPKTLPDLFDLCGPEEFGAYADPANHEAMFAESLAALRASQGLPPAPFGDYFNAGVMVLGKCHAGLFTAPPKMVPPGRGRWAGSYVPTDQNWLNIRVRETGTKLAKLPRWANWFGADEPPAGVSVVHHHIGLSLAERLARMRAAVPRMEGRTDGP